MLMNSKTTVIFTTFLYLGLGNTVANGQVISDNGSSVETSLGGNHSGGGVYGLDPTTGQWTLTDFLESGENIDPFESAGVEELLIKVETMIPEFAREMRRIARDKNWLVVNFKLRCPDSPTVADVAVQVGACQDAFDVRMNRDFYSNDRTSLIIHELIQGLRLYRMQANRVIIPYSAVGGIHRMLVDPNVDATKLQTALRLRGFGEFLVKQQVDDRSGYIDSVLERFRQSYCQYLTPNFDGYWMAREATKFIKQEESRISGSSSESWKSLELAKLSGRFFHLFTIVPFTGSITSVDLGEKTKRGKYVYKDVYEKGFSRLDVTPGSETTDSHNYKSLESICSKK